MLFRKKFYLSAQQCFKNAGDAALETRCVAYQHADRATALLGEAESKSLQSKSKLYKKSEKHQMKKEAKELRVEAFQELEQAGLHFEKIGMHRHAAQCYCTALRL